MLVHPWTHHIWPGKQSQPIQTWPLGTLLSVLVVLPEKNDLLCALHPKSNGTSTQTNMIPLGGLPAHFKTELPPCPLGFPLYLFGFPGFIQIIFVHVSISPKRLGVLYGLKLSLTQL